ncbi:MAG TPA: hypothetical protein VFA26_24495, partial [Gemmataceae bacterium]|nr:hypothetical protein [Gemmataceae bacterium]
QQLRQQRRQLEELNAELGRAEEQRRRPAAPPAADPPPKDARPAPDPEAVKKIVGDYLKDNPGAGMPPGVQTGYEPGRGFIIRSGPNPAYVKWADDCRIPFELRVSGRIQMDYYAYKTTDGLNHLTGVPTTLNANATRLPDVDLLEIKRANLRLEGSAFDPDLKYRLEFNGFTRGVQGLQNNKVIQTAPAGGTAPNTAPVSPTGGGVSVDHTVTLFEAFASYDFHGCAAERGCGPDCPDGTSKYVPTYTIIAGKMKPFFGLDEFLGNRNMQFVEFSMADLFFDADDDARLMAAGFQIKQLEDRFFLQALMTNGSEGAFFPSSHLDNYPGFISGVWYDVGGTWNASRKAWDLFGDSIADIDYSVKPVARLGGCVNLVPMNRRSLYGDAEQSRYFVVPGAPGSTRLINVLNGDLALPPGAHAVDKFDAYTYTVFLSGKYRGLSLHNEWWLRNLNNFQAAPDGRGVIIYQDSLGPGGASRNALFPSGQGIIDYGMELSAGYFLVPRKLEVAARWSYVRGQSGDINGNGTFRNATVPGLATPVHVVNGAFRNFHEADEYTVGLNYYFKRQLLKWQTDVGFYKGGNPVGPAGQSIGGFIGGQDGYLLRTQIQMAF